MQILEESSGGQAPPEFMSSHPNPGNRIARIEEVISQVYPNGVPAGLEP
jgi:beta-barrel assembly-enhancing protease